jgi:hypothetical protein
MAKVIYLNEVIGRKALEIESAKYQTKITQMDRLELLEEMVRFQQERSSVDKLNLKLLLNGRILFKALAETSVTPEMRLLTRSYFNHLTYELDHFQN